jgi:high affinity Mn2+ porin
MIKTHTLTARAWAFALACIASPAIAQTDSMAKAQAKNKLENRFNLHFQTTYIYQYKPAFPAPYTGTNSIIPGEEKQNSLTATLYFGARLWRGAELYINPEVAGGSGLSGAFGLGASTNGETFRVGDPAPTLYLGRGYLSQTFAIGAAKSVVDEQANEVGGAKPTNYLRFLLGKLSLGDIFDNNEIANAPRTQYMNWCLMNNGSWDYAANTRGYTYAFVGILQHNTMTYEAAMAMLPKVANGPDLNTDLSQAYSLNAEVSKEVTLKNKRKGNIRLMGFYNNGHMGNYRDAINYPLITGPDIVSTRQYGRTKYGFGLSTDLELSSNAGVFFRCGWNDGHNETWAFTEVDQAISAGITFNGETWRRNEDRLGIALLANGLSQDHRDYLAHGGLGFQLGDGHLSYGHEAAVEVYYSCKPVAAGLWLTGDYQFVVNPGYNADRGPVHVFSLRLHVEL